MALTTFTPVIIKHHIKKDGSVNVKIRITHNRKSRYLPSDEIAQKEQYNSRTLVIKDNAMLLRLNKLIERMENAIRKIDIFERDEMDVDTLIEKMKVHLNDDEPFFLEFIAYGRAFASARSKYAAVNYRCALNSLCRFLEKDSIDISEITSSLMRRYEEYLISKHGPEARAVSLYTSAIATIHKDAQRKFNNEERDEIRIRDPFQYYKPPKQNLPKKRGVEYDTIQKLIDIRGSLSKYHKRAVDTFLLSFATMGTNIPDLYEATRKGNVIYYNRAKTKARRHDNAEMQIRLEPICDCLFKDMEDPTRKRAFILHNQYTHYHSITDKANDRLKEVAKLIGVPPFTMYAARHTFASFAYSIGIPKSLINDMLCHVDPNMSVTDIYIKKDWSVLWKANRKVLKKFVWK